MKQQIIKHTAIAIMGIVAASCFSGCIVVPGRRHRVIHPPRPGVVKPRPVVVRPRPIVVKPHPVKIVRPPMPKKPRVSVPKRPAGNYAWVSGNYVWDGRRWAWKKGYWKRAPKGKAKGHYK
jgi:hypothetical protein